MVETAAMNTPVETVIAALEAGGYRPRQRGSQWYARCPVHGGKDTDSLSIAAGHDGRVLLTCHSRSCRYHDIMNALDLDPSAGFVNVVNFQGHNIGLRSPEPTTHTGLGNPEAEYDYTDENGNLLYQVLRYRTGDGKTFRQRRPDGDGWAWSIGDVRRVLYRLPAVLGAIERGDRVFVVEGEKDVHTLESLGMTATCAMGGACEKASSWSPAWSEALTGAEVVILPDNDEPGQQHARIVTAALEGHATTVRTVQLPDLPPKGDVTDWVTAGGDAETLTKLATETHLKLMSFSDLIFADLPPKEPLMVPWLLTQDLAMVYAKRGVGKTMFLLELTVGLSCGGSVFNWEVPEPVHVVYVDGEMPGVTMQERMGQLAKSRINDMKIEPSFLIRDLQPNGLRTLSVSQGRVDLLDAIPKTARVVILDNLSCLYGGAENDAEAWDDMQDLLIELRHRGITCIMVHHAGKSGDQRGTSRREDILDTVVKLSRPSDYRPEDGARFLVEFEKARNIRGSDVRDIEVELIKDDTGLMTWAVVSGDDARARQVYKLKSEGLSQRAIATETGIGLGTVNRILKGLNE
jgi:putative DNA primase/helicase